jgi:predicted transcriptional regulator
MNILHQLNRFLLEVEGYYLVNYRSRLDIIADILRAAEKNAKKTQIMYQANLNYKVLQKYLTEILGSSLIYFEEEKRLYVLTDKGKEFLTTYQGYYRTNKHLKKWQSEAHIKKNILEKLSSSRS